METLWQDVKYGARMLRRSPGFTAVAVLSLALGIGANATVFSWIQGVLLNPLPGVPEAERIVTLETLTPTGEMIDTSYPDFRDFRDRSSSFDSFCVFKERPLNLGQGAEARRIWGLMVSGAYFDVLRVKPALGRFFSTEEQQDKYDAFPVAILSNALWKREFQSSPAAIGKTVHLNRLAFTVIGVAPEEFRGSINGLVFDVYVPLTMQASLTGSNNWLEARRTRPLYPLARLKHGVTLEQARGEVRSIAAALAADYPQSNQELSATLLPFAQGKRGAQNILSATLMILMYSAGVVLLIVCSNVANLLLARSAARRRELAVRVALGAAWPRVVRQLFTESLLLGLLGGTLGVLLAVWLTDWIMVFVPATDRPVSLSTPVNLNVLLFTTGLSVLAAVLFGMAPALGAARRSTGESLKEGGRGVMGSRTAGRVRGWLASAEVALALVALVCAGLLFRSFQNARNVQPGFDAKDVLLVGIQLSSSGYDRDSGLAYFRRLEERVRRLPGVQYVAFSEDVPLGLARGSWEHLDVKGYVPAPGENMKIYRNPVSPEYFQLMRIPILEGRAFTDGDDETSQPVAIVNQLFVKRYFGGGNAIGRTFRALGRDLSIVGVARDTLIYRLNEPAEPYFYIPFRQFYRASMGAGLHIRVQGAPEQLLPQVRAEMQAIDPTVHSHAATTLEEFIGGASFAHKVAAGMMSALGGLALFLASLGLYSVMAYTVAQRSHEIGIRMALGAKKSDVLRLVVGEGMGLALSGVAVGITGALAATRLLGSLLFGVSGWDPLTFVLVAALLSGVALAACLIPALRATRVDPLVALRYE
jgi:predicted permease